MWRTRALELCWCLYPGPALTIELANVDVKGFGKNWAGWDGSVWAVWFLIFAMAFIKNTSPHSVQFFNTCQVNVLDEGTEKKEKVFIPSLSSIDEVLGSHTEEIIDFWPQGKEDFSCLLIWNGGNLCGRFTDLDNILVIRQGILKVTGGKNCCHVRRFQGS